MSSSPPVREQPTELLLVVPARLVRAAGVAQGFDPSPDPILAAVSTPRATRVMPRSEAEADPHFKQLVCYVILRSEGTVFHYRRSAAVGEPRLAGLRSLGVGGHVNATDGTVGAEGLDRAIRRELAEEVVLTETPTLRYLGVINDDSTEVGRVHLGLVALAELRRPLVRLRDPTLVDGRFDAPARLLDQASAFEGWSRLCLPALINLPAAS